MSSPPDYEAWYHTPRGRWIGDLEFKLLSTLLPPISGATLLDVGCGTGYFSRRFRQAGLSVTGIDPDIHMLEYARQQSNEIDYQQGRAESLPYANDSFDYVAAVTSLCFVEQPELAVAEMWRVAKQAVLLGLLNRNSLLYLQKHHAAGYRGARWDSCDEAIQWFIGLRPDPDAMTCHSALFMPGGGHLARRLEKLLPSCWHRGGFLALCIRKPTRKSSGVGTRD